MGLFGFNLFGKFCAPWTSMTIYFPKLGTFSATVYSYKYPAPFCSLSSSETPILWILIYLILLKIFLKLSSLFIFYLFLFCFADWMISSILKFSCVHPLSSWVQCASLWPLLWILFEYFIRWVTFLYFIIIFFFWDFILFFSLEYISLSCYFTWLSLSVSINLAKQPPLPLLKEEPCVGASPA